jgi:signal transduction histidine kinase
VLTGIRQARVREAAFHRWRHPAVGVAVAVAGAIVTLRGQPAPSADGRGLAISIALAGFIIGALTVAYAIDRVPGLLLGAAALTFASSAVLLGLQPHKSVGVFGPVLALAAITFQLRGRPVLAVGLGAILFLTLVAEMSQQRPLVASMAFCFPPLALSWLVLLLSRLRDAKEQAEALLVDLAESRSAEARAAALAERYHLAREMHDVLAHSLSALQLQLEGARMLAESDPSDPRLPETVGRAHELAKEGLKEARDAIGMLRGEELPGPVALGTLAGQFERRSGISCSFDTAGDARNVRPDARLALYRVAQESLTNVIKHSSAKRVEVRLAYEPDRVCLTIEDFGPSSAPAAGGKPGGKPGSGSGSDSGSVSRSGYGRSGYGLTGMRERAQLLGGTFTAGVTPAGYRVELQIPA